MTRPDILKQIADAHYQLADLYLQLAGDTATAPVSAARPEAAAGSAAPASFDSADYGDIPGDYGMDGPSPQGSLAQCPAHHKPYSEGKYGPYCTAQAISPAWADKKGYCRITPKNAAAYLRETAGVAV